MSWDLAGKTAVALSNKKGGVPPAVTVFIDTVENIDRQKLGKILFYFFPLFPRTLFSRRMEGEEKGLAGLGIPPLAQFAQVASRQKVSLPGTEFRSLKNSERKNGNGTQRWVNSPARRQIPQIFISRSGCYYDSGLS